MVRLAGEKVMVVRESRMQGQPARPVWRGLGRNGPQQWEYRAPLPPYITYIPTQEGWLYLAVILDLFSRRIVGWAMSDRMTSNLTLGALSMAIRRRQPGPGLTDHSDQGSQYTDKKYQALLRIHGIHASMNGVGSWYDNAPVESFFGTLKSERVHHYPYRTHDEASPDLFYYIEGFYNRRRLHSSLGYLSPEGYEVLCRVRHRL
jgi:transposase InsO family protein